MIDSSIFDINDLKRRMQATLELLGKELTGLRAGRANPALLDPIKVDAYGSTTPLSQVGSISAPEPRMLTVQVWDKGLVKSVEKAIRDCGLGLNPCPEGQLIRISMPEPTQQRRQELSKQAAKYAEDGRISVRNIRRDGMDVLKKLEKNKKISEDEQLRLSAEIQQQTDQFIKKVDEQLVQKQKEILQV